MRESHTFELLRLIRYADCTAGLLCFGGVRLCYTLEGRAGELVPEGLYPLGLRWTWRGNRLHLNDVPNYEHSPLIKSTGEPLKGDILLGHSLQLAEFSANLTQSKRAMRFVKALTFGFFELNDVVDLRIMDFTNLKHL